MPREEPANDGEVGDLDGDGRPDTVGVASPGNGRRVLGVETAAGGGDAVDIASASPVALQVLVADADDGQGTVTWTRTIIERDGLIADEGPTTEGTYEHPRDDAAIELLRSVTFGDLTLTEDGIPQPEE